MSGSGVQWWCSAGGGSWTWTWRPYPGVWLFIAAIATAFAFRWRAALRRERGEPASRRPVLAAAGVLLLWCALDWPIGPLGAGYLETAHMVQFVLIVMLAPPLLLEGSPRPQRVRVAGLAGIAALAGRPASALVLSAALVVAGHTSVAVDTLMATQLGSLVLDLTWLAAGLLLWSPLLSPRRDARLAAGPQALIYLFLAMLPDKAVGIWLLLAPWPVYRTYELAPPLGGITALADQQLGAGIMLGAGMVILFIAVAILVRNWGVATGSAGGRGFSASASRR